MDTIFATNILFFVLSIFITILAIGAAFLVVYMVLVLKSIYVLFKVMKLEGEKIVSDIEAIRSKVKDGGIAFTSFVLHLFSFLKKHKKSKE